MKKSVFIFTALMFAMICGISNVSAAETWGLFIFDDSTSTLTYPYSSIRTKAKVGDQIQLEAKLCSYDSSNTDAKISKDSSNCKDVEVNWSTPDTQAISVSNNGLIKILKGTYGGASIIAETKDIVSEVAGTAGSAIKLSESYSISSIEASNNELTDFDDDDQSVDYDDEETVDEDYKNDFSKKVRTTTNPITGIETYWVYIVPVIIAGGSFIALKNGKKI